MAQDNAERVPIGRTALGGAACGFTYDGALLDAVARELKVSLRCIDLLTHKAQSPVLGPKESGCCQH